MSTYTFLYTDIAFYGKTYRTKYEVKEDLEECESVLQNCKNELCQLVMMTEPNKFMPTDETDPLWWIQRHLGELLETYEEYLRKVDNLALLLDKWDSCHDKDGKAIGTPKGVFKNGRSYIEGDYIDSYYEDGTKKECDDYAEYNDV